MATQHTPPPGGGARQVHSILEAPCTSMTMMCSVSGWDCLLTHYCTNYLTRDSNPEYNPGRQRDFQNHGRKPCTVDYCVQTGDCADGCPYREWDWVRLTNNVVFLCAGTGLNVWMGRLEIVGFECHDCGISIQALESGFWIDNLLAQCRTGEPLALPPNSKARQIAGRGFGM